MMFEFRRDLRIFVICDLVGESGQRIQRSTNPNRPLKELRLDPPQNDRSVVPESIYWPFWIESSGLGRKLQG